MGKVGPCAQVHSQYKCVQAQLCRIFHKPEHSFFPHKLIELIPLESHVKPGSANTFSFWLL